MSKSKNKLLNKVLAFVLTFSLLATLVSFNFTASAVGGTLNGTGTVSDPYIIEDYQDLVAFASNVNNGEVNANAKIADTVTTIEVSEEWTAIGVSDNGIVKYEGVFNGNNKTINFGNGITAGDYMGLFAVNEGTVQNLTVNGNSTIDASAYNNSYFGGIAALNRGTIEKCTSSMTISVTGTNPYAGGIAGVMQNGTIKSCTNLNSISVTSNSVSEDIRDHEASVGGIVAFNYNGAIEKCTNNGSITNTDTQGYTGGIVGCNNGTVNNSLNTGDASNKNSTYNGGIAGNLFKNTDTGTTASISNSLSTSANSNVYGNNSDGKVTNCYYKAEEETNSDEGTEFVTTTKLENGEVAFKLNGENGTNGVWGQVLEGEAKEPTPVIGSSNVYQSDNTYTNTQPDCTSHNYVNGVCAICHDVAVKVSGYTITLNGEIGINYVFNVKTELGMPTVTFVKDNEEISATVEKGASKDTYTTYTATVPVDSDQMNLDIVAKVQVGDISYESNPYTVNKYLNSLYTNPSLATNKSAELKAFVQAMSTYGYYSNRYFADYAAYESPIGLLNMTVTGDEIGTEYGISYGGTNNGWVHYGSSLQHLEKIAAVFYVDFKGTDSTNAVMQYQYVNVSDNSPVKDDTYYTSDLIGNHAITEKIPIAELKTTKIAATFGTMTEGTYTAKTKTKYYAPYGYIKGMLDKYSNDTKNLSYKLVQALYHYSEAAKVYFDAVAATE